MLRCVNVYQCHYTLCVYTCNHWASTVHLWFKARRLSQLDRTSYTLTDSKPINGSVRTPAGAKGKFTLNLNVAKERENGRVLYKKIALNFPLWTTTSVHGVERPCRDWFMKRMVENFLWNYTEVGLSQGHQNCIILTMNSAYIFNLSFCKVLSLLNRE